MHTFAIIGFIWFALVFLLMAVIYFWPLTVQRFLRRRALSKVAGKHVIQGTKHPLTTFEAGHGPNLILLHGAGDHAGTWSDLARRLAPEMRLIMPDLPGHGASPWTDASLTLGDVFAGLEALMDGPLNGQTATLMGNSMGGWIALLYAVRHTDRVDGLILENSGGIRRDSDGPNLVPKTMDEARALLDATRGPDGPDIPKFVLRHLIKTTQHGPLAKLARSDGEPYFLDDRLSQLNVPTVVVWGEDDGLLPLEYAESLTAKIPGATLKLIPRAGHIPHLEKPDDVITVVREFLKQPQEPDT